MKSHMNRRFCQVMSSLLVIVPLGAGCSQSSQQTTGSDRDLPPCLVNATKNETSIHSSCRTGLALDGRDMGMVNWTYDIDGSRACDEFVSEAQIEGTADTPAGTVRITLDESTGKLTYSSSTEGDVSILPGDKPDWLIARTFVPGAAAPNDKHIYCPNLEQTAANLAHADGYDDAADCNGNDGATDTASMSFYCEELQTFLESQDVYRNLFMRTEGHVVAGHILLRETRDIAIKHGAPRKAAVVAFIGVVVSAIATVFKSPEYDTLFNKKGNNGQGAWEGNKTN